MPKSPVCEALTDRPAEGLPSAKPTDDPDPESLFVPVDDEIGAIHYDRDDSTKGNTNPKSAKLPIIGLPHAVQHSGYLGRSARFAISAPIFTKKPTAAPDLGRKSAVPDHESSSHKVSCIEKFLSQREREGERRRRNDREGSPEVKKSELEPTVKTGCCAGIAGAFRCYRGGVGGERTGTQCAEGSPATVDQEIFSAEDARASAAAGDCPKHVVSLTSTTYGVLSFDRDEADQAKKKELKREEERPHPPEQQHQMLVGVGVKEEEKVEAAVAVAVAVAEEEEEEKEVGKRECKRSPPHPPPHTPFSKKRTASAAGARDEPSEVIDARELMEDLSDNTPFWSPLKKPHIKPHQHLLMPASSGTSTPNQQQQQKSSLLAKENPPVQQHSTTIPRDSGSCGGARRSLSLSLEREHCQEGEQHSQHCEEGEPLFDPDLIASLEREHCEEGIKKALLLQSYAKMCPPGGECAVVLYTTTLRVIRKTFEDCKAVRSAIEAYDVQIVERDISMESSYREELRTLVGKKDVKVPLTFVKGRLIGDAEDILRLEEEGILGLLLEGIPRATKAR